MLSKQINLQKHQPGVSTYVYWQKQQPVSQIQNYIDQEQNVEFRIETNNYVVNLSESSLCMELTTSVDLAQYEQIIFNALKGILQGLELTTGSGQQLYKVDKHVWAFAQLNQMYKKDHNDKYSGNTYEGNNFTGYTTSFALNIADDVNSLIDSSEYQNLKNMGFQISYDSFQAGSRKIYIQIPLKKLGGIFDDSMGFIPFSDSLVYMKLKLLPRSQCFGIYNANTNATSALGNNLVVNQFYLNVCRSQDPEINNTLLQQVSSGIQMPYKYISAQYDTILSDRANITHQITRDYGLKIRQIYSAFIDIDQTLGVFHNVITKNPSGFLRVGNAKQATQTEVQFNNTTMKHCNPQLDNQGLQDWLLVQGRFHVRTPLCDDEIFDSGFELGNATTTYTLQEQFAVNLANYFCTTFFEGIQYIQMSSNAIKTRG